MTSPAMSSPVSNRGWLLIAPAILVFGLLFGWPLLNLFFEALRPFVPGRVGGDASAPLTLVNFLQLAEGSFLRLVYDTFRISIIAAFCGVALSYPLAYSIVRRFSPLWRTMTVGALVLLVLLSVLVRTYALELTLGSVGPFRGLLLSVGIQPNSRGYIEFLVILGLIQHSVPISTLILLGSIQGINPNYSDASCSLGAPWWVTHRRILLPLAMPGLLASFLIATAAAVSSFVIPMILGKGKVMFVSNVIYSRFNDVINYPSGAAVSVFMLVASLLLIAAISQLARLGGRQS